MDTQQLSSRRGKHNFEDWRCLRLVDGEMVKAPQVSGQDLPTADRHLLSWVQPSLLSSGLATKDEEPRMERKVENCAQRPFSRAKRREHMSVGEGVVISDDV